METAGMYSPRGWTTQRGINRLLKPFLLQPQPGRKTLKDYDPFAGLSGATAHRLLMKLPIKNLTDRQNNAPSCAELLELSTRENQNLELFGYAIGPGRYDERITIEGFIYYGKLAPQIPLLIQNPGQELLLWEALTNRLGLKSYLTPPDEIHYLRPHWNLSQAGWWVWWD